MSSSSNNRLDFTLPEKLAQMPNDAVTLKITPMKIETVKKDKTTGNSISSKCNLPCFVKCCCESYFCRFKRQEGETNITLYKRRMCIFVCYFWSYFVLSLLILNFTIMAGDNGLDCPLPSNLNKIPSIEDYFIGRKNINDASEHHLRCWSKTSNNKNKCNSSLYLPINKLQLKGTHNSYKMKPKFNFWMMGINTLIPDLQYEFDSLALQLDNNVRHFELDIHFGDSNRILNYHLPEIDKQTRCRCFIRCLQTIKTWSDQHANHLPIFVALEIKDGWWIEDYKAYLNTPGENELQLIEKYILSVWWNGDAVDNRIFMPDQLRGNYTSLNAAVRACGWPSVNEMRNKIVFTILETDEVRSAYTETPHESLENRLMFTLPNGNNNRMFDKDVAMGKFDSSLKDLKAIKEHVAAGFFIRTRGVTVTDQSIKRLKAAAMGGAQLISLDGDIHSLWEKYIYQENNLNAAKCGSVNVSVGGCTWVGC